MTRGVSIIIPTFNGGSLFERSLAALRQQNFDGDVHIVVVDSGSCDGTVETARRFDAEVTSIPVSEFRHARTRNSALRLARHPFVLFTVQDAVPIDSNWLSTCVACLEDASITAAFGRQIPHDDADLFARYSVERHSESLGKRRKVYSLSNYDFARADFMTALKAIRLDNVCAIYRRRFLEEIPFPDVRFGEDLAWSLQAQRAGHCVLYEPAIRVYHSHNRPPDYDFRRSLTGIISTSHILGKLPIDRETVGMPEILEMKRHLQKLGEELLDRPICKGYFMRRLEVPILRFIHSHGSRLLPASPKRLRRRVGHWLRMRISGTWDWKKEPMFFQYKDAGRRYPQSDAGEWKRFLSRLAASEYGKFVAEVYLSRQFRGDVPGDMEEFVASNMKGA